MAQSDPRENPKESPNALPSASRRRVQRVFCFLRGVVCHKADHTRSGTLKNLSLTQPIYGNCVRLVSVSRDRFTATTVTLVRRWASWRGSWRRTGRGCWWSCRRDTCGPACRTPPDPGAARYPLNSSFSFVYLEKVLLTRWHRPRERECPERGECRVMSIDMVWGPYRGEALSLSLRRCQWWQAGLARGRGSDLEDVVANAGPRTGSWVKFAPSGVPRAVPGRK